MAGGATIMRSLGGCVLFGFALPLVKLAPSMSGVRMGRWGGIAGLVLAATALPTHAAPPAIEAPFSSEEVAWSSGPGANVIEGDALLRTRGGEVRTCAGFKALLFPDSDHTREWARARFGSAWGGFRKASDARRSAWPDQRMFQFVRTTTCNAQGQFRFTGLPDGRYLLITQVTWSVRIPGYYSSGYTSHEGGEMADSVQVMGGEVYSKTYTR